MALRSKILIAGILLIIAFSFGRYTAPKKTEIREVVKTEIQIQKEVERVERTEKDGTRTVWTHLVANVQSVQSVQKEQVTQYKADSVTVSALASVSMKDMSLVYGLSISKPVIGPIAVGVFGFSDGRVGMSLGINL